MNVLTALMNPEINKKLKDKVLKDVRDVELKKLKDYKIKCKYT